MVVLLARLLACSDFCLDRCEPETAWLLHFFSDNFILDTKGLLPEEILVDAKAKDDYRIKHR